MSTAGLRKVGNYEEVLAQAIKDEQHVGGVINPYLANAATRIINNPEFQRVKDRLEDDLTQQTRNHMDQTNFEHHVTNLGCPRNYAVPASIAFYMLLSTMELPLQG